MSGAAEAKDRPRREIDIAASSLPEAIAELSREAGVSIGTDGPIPDLRTPAIHGRMDVGEALKRLLAGTGFQARKVGRTAWRIERMPLARRRESTDSTLGLAVGTFAPEPIVVTATKRDRALNDLPIAVSVIGLLLMIMYLLIR